MRGVTPSAAIIHGFLRHEHRAGEKVCAVLPVERVCEPGEGILEDGGLVTEFGQDEARRGNSCTKTWRTSCDKQLCDGRLWRGFLAWPLCASARGPRKEATDTDSFVFEAGVSQECPHRRPHTLNDIQKTDNQNYVNPNVKKLLSTWESSPTQCVRMFLSHSPSGVNRTRQAARPLEGHGQGSLVRVASCATSCFRKL